MLPPLTTAGREIFMERCMTCHGPGHESGRPLPGPDLETISVGEPRWLLEAILDPARQIAPEYWLYRLETEEGEPLEGMIAAETRDSLTIRPLFGESETVARSAIRRFERLDRSPMPEGLESGLTPEQMAGLLAFLRDTGAP
jgi:putative heme-binding domain-containing protein